MPIVPEVKFTREPQSPPPKLETMVVEGGICQGRKLTITTEDPVWIEFRLDKYSDEGGGSVSRYLKPRQVRTLIAGLEEMCTRLEAEGSDD